MKREFSAGGIVFNNQGEVLLIKTTRTNDPSKIFWSFPKGHIEEGQTVEEAAIREVREEGGVNAKIISQLGQSKYYRTYNQQKIFKTVTYFMMEYLDGDPKDHDHEVEEARWFEPTQALEALSYPEDKKLLEQALQNR